MTKYSWPAMLVANAVALLACPGASAAIKTNYVGASCVQNNTTSPTVFRYGNRAGNASPTSSMEVVCPVDQQGGRVMSARVAVSEFNPTREIMCRIDVQDENESGLVLSPIKSSGAAATGLAILKFDAMPVGASYANGTKFIRCQLGPAQGMDSSFVLGFTVTEE